MARPRSDLFVALALMGLGALVIWLWPTGSILSTVLGILIALVVPGYAVQAAIFAPRELPWPARGLAIVGLSLATGVIGGIVLYLTPFGLRPITWYLWFASATLVGCMVAFWRFPLTPFAAPEASAPLRLNVLAQLLPVALVGVALLISGTALYLSRLPAPPNNTQGYTQLWMVPAPPGVQPVVQLGIASSEFSLETYDVQVTMDGRLILNLHDIQLAPGDTWQRALELPSSQSVLSLRAELYRANDPNTVYRSTKLVLDLARK